MIANRIRSFLRSVQSVPFIAKYTMLLMWCNPISRQTYSMITVLAIRVEVSCRNFSRCNRDLLCYRSNTTTYNSGIL